MRDAIPPSQRLSITLRYLATGNAFENLKFTSAISPQSIGIIVMETCTALTRSSTQPAVRWLRHLCLLLVILTFCQ